MSSFFCTPKRKPVTAKWFFENNHNDKPAYLYSREADDLHLECWKLIDGVDPLTDGTACDIWFANGASKRAALDTTIYVSVRDFPSLATI